MLKEAKLVRIGNSRGVRLPKTLIAKYRLGERVILEARPEGILIKMGTDGKLSWEDTYKAMAAEADDEWAEREAVDFEEEHHL